MLNWIAKSYNGTPDALRIISYLMLQDGWIDSLHHFPHTRTHVAECIKAERESLIKTYGSQEAKIASMSGLLCLIRLCRCQYEGILDEIKSYFSKTQSSHKESTQYYILCLQALIDEFDILKDKDQDSQIRLVCGLCQTKWHKEFSNARTIAWLINCAEKRKNRYGDKAAAALSILVKATDASESIFDTAMDRLIDLFAALEKNSAAYKSLASSYIHILEPRLWRIVNNSSIIKFIAEWLILGAIEDEVIDKYLKIVEELTKWEDAQLIFASPNYIESLCNYF